MAVIDGIVSGVSALGNAVLSPVTLVSRLARTGLEHYKTKHEQDLDAPVQIPAPPEDASLPDPEAASDPAISLIGHTLAMATGIQLLIQGGEGGKPDWATIHAKDSVNYPSPPIIVIVLLTSAHRNQRIARSTSDIVYMRRKRNWIHPEGFRSN